MAASYYQSIMRVTINVQAEQTGKDCDNRKRVEEIQELKLSIKGYPS